MTEVSSARDLAEQLVVTCEEVLLGLPQGGQNAVARTGSAAFFTLASPIALITRGLTQIRRRTVVVIAVLLVGGLLVNGTIASTLPRDALFQINAVWAILSVGALLLPSPSDIGFGVYNTQDFERAYARLGRLVTLSEGAIEPHRQLIRRAEERSLQRLSTLKWLLAATWAIIVYLGQQGFEKKDGELLGAALTPLIMTIFAVGLILCYARGVNAVFALASALLAQRAVDIAYVKQIQPPQRVIFRGCRAKPSYRSNEATRRCR